MPPEYDDEGVSDDHEDFSEVDANEDFDADDGNEIDGDADGGEADYVEDDLDAADEGDGEFEGRSSEVGRRKRKGIGDIRREAREAKAEAAALKARLEALERGQQPQRQTAPQETPEQRAAKLAAMTPDARADFLIRESEAKMTNAINNMAYQNFDAADQTKFDALCERNPAVRAVKADVEKERQRLLGIGQIVDRQTITRYVLGGKVLESAPAARKKAKQRGDEAMRRQEGKPGNGRSDQRRQSQRSGSEREQRRKRLENVNL